MRACGISAARTVTPIVAACVLLAAFYHVLANEWTPHASAVASRIKNVEIKNRSATRHSVWQQADDSLYEIAVARPAGRAVAEGVTFYELGPDGLPKSRTEALQRPPHRQRRLAARRSAAHGDRAGVDRATRRRRPTRRSATTCRPRSTRATCRCASCATGDPRRRARTATTRRLCASRRICGARRRWPAWCCPRWRSPSRRSVLPSRRSAR